MCIRLFARVAVLAVLVAAASGIDSSTLQPDFATTVTDNDYATAASTTFAAEETATDSTPMMVRVEIPSVAGLGDAEDDDAESVRGNDIGEPSRTKDARKLDGALHGDIGPIGLPVAMMTLPSPALLRGPVVVVAPNATAATLPPPSPLPALDGDEDFMTDMQEMETDMEMAERSASSSGEVPAAVAAVDDSEEQVSIRPSGTPVPM